VVGVATEGRSPTPGCAHGRHLAGPLCLQSGHPMWRIGGYCWVAQRALTMKPLFPCAVSLATESALGETRLLVPLHRSFDRLHEPVRGPGIRRENTLSATAASDPKRSLNATLAPFCDAAGQQLLLASSHYTAALKANESAPTRIRLEAQTASRLNQLRETNFSPR
jgi:hypothetical protein